MFFALGLGYGSVIAYSSYNPVNNNCHRDALLVSCINFMTSVLASLVVFVVLGFRAKNIALHCVAEYVCVFINRSKGILCDSYRCVDLISCRNLGVLNLMASNGASQHWWPMFNITDPSSVSIAEYRQWFGEYGSMVGPKITDCSLEEEMNKVLE